ncbi:hypothetical protein [Pandoraea horticolens]|uniref:hypothetical protein n=1 Tax=Pandoraea horticolens TaxID=2508298 RepID=UPI001FE76E1B|nr:hypothetical protein [Pandoraea horticolens]
MLKYRRTLGTTLNAPIDAGFLIQKVEEFAPTAAQIRATPSLADMTSANGVSCLGRASA